MEKVKKYLEKAKNRVIHEFEYQNGKYIQHYVLGGEHELKPQEIVDCLNALATMDCDLQTAYAYIKGQDEKNKELKEQVEEIRKSQKITFETLLITDKALELATNYCQKEIDGDGIGMQDIQAIYEIGTEFFINKAKEGI